MDELTVESGLDAAGEPVPVRFGPDGERRVEEILDRWYGEGHVYFRVRDQAGSVWILRHDEARGDWRLEFFEREGEAP